MTPTAPAPGRAFGAAPLYPADAVLLGEAVVDLFAAETGQPLDEAERFVRHLGGASANLAVGLSRQGVRTALITLVGPDAFGRFLRARLHDEGVVGDGVTTHRSARTALTFVSVGAQGERAFLSYRQPSADMLLSTGDFTPAQIQRGRLLGLSSSTLLLPAGRAATQHALEVAAEAGLLLLCDLNFRPHLWGDPKEALAPLRRLLSQCDVVKLTQQELLPVLGVEQLEAACSKVRRMGPTLVVITLGAQGCFVDCPAGQAYLAADPVRTVDPTGAGDAFTAGLTSTLLGELGGRDGQRERLRALTLAQVKRACARGNYLGARVCTAIGATTALPLLGAVG